MIPYHIIEQLKCRGLPFCESDLESLAIKCRSDTAICLTKLSQEISVSNSPDNKYRTESRSNGDLVILIVRNKKPITIMFRRSNQPFTTEALRVQAIMDLS